MAIDHRIGNKVQKSLRREDAPATRVDPHPYIGIVKNNLDPTRTGRLQVWIPDLGGNPDDPKNWRTVGYASPYMGTTDIVKSSQSKPNTDNKFTNTPHPYGFWMVPPDIGIEVIVIFIAGDPLKGFWIACVNSALSRYMLPAIAASSNTDLSGASGDITQTLSAGASAPVTEFNENDPAADQKPAFYTNPKPVHEPQYRVLKEQGLDRDTARGIITSSSQRESPSQVFGISTPGRPYPDAGADNPDAFLAKVNAGTLTETDYAYTTRKGGHSLVMDDGDLVGNDQLVRLRTGGGHQIMMNDTNNSLYINHRDGTSWIELTSNGSLNIYSKAGFNVRSEGTINLHSDRDVNINARQNINLSAGSKFQLNSSQSYLLQSSLNVETSSQTEFKAGAAFVIDAGAKVSVKAGGVLALEGSKILQNSGGTSSAKAVEPIHVNSLSDAGRASSGALWESQSGALSTIATVAPTHEPYDRGTAPYAAPIGAGIRPGTYSGTNDATKSTSGTSLKNPATATDLRNQPKCDCTIGKLTSDQLTAYYATIGKSESGGKYDVVNSIGFVGKYQFGYPALIDGGYVTKSCKSNAQLNNPNVWIGKDGIDSLQAWLANGPVQEAAMCAYTTRNYTTMCKIGAITADQPAEDIAGMLAVSHLLGAGGAKSWRNGSGGADAYGTTGDQYFQKGKYAVAVLAPQMPTVNAG